MASADRLQENFWVDFQDSALTCDDCLTTPSLPGLGAREYEDPEMYEVVFTDTEWQLVYKGSGSPCVPGNYLPDDQKASLGVIAPLLASGAGVADFGIQVKADTVLLRAPHGSAAEGAINPHHLYYSTDCGSNHVVSDPAPSTGVVPIAPISLCSLPLTAHDYQRAGCCTC